MTPHSLSHLVMFRLYRWDLFLVWEMGEHTHLTLSGDSTTLLHFIFLFLSLSLFSRKYSVAADSWS